MKRGFKIYTLIWVLCFILFQAAVFLIPNIAKFGGSFWVGYICTSAAFAGQIVVARFAFRADEAKKMFYNISLLIVSYGGLGAMLLTSVITVGIPFLPIWVGALICIAVLIFSAIAVISAGAAIQIVSDIDRKTKTASFTIRTLTADAEHLMAETKDTALKTETKKVYEAIRYSDPISNVALIEINESIQREFAAFADAVQSEDLDLSQATALALLNLLDKRNKQCRLLK